MDLTTVSTAPAIGSFLLNKTTQAETLDLVQQSDESFDLTWNDVVYEGGPATWTTRSSIRWLTISVCLIGILGNALAVCTLVRRRMRSLSTYAYLTALCLSNCVTLLSVIIFEVEIFLTPTRSTCIVTSLAKSFASSTFALSTWITVGFTADRYIMICYPFTGEKMCTRRNASFVLIVCLLLASAYLVPQLFANTCHIMSTGDSFDYNSSSPSNQTEVLNAPVFWISGLSNFGKSLAYRLIITLFINCFLVRIIPFLVVLKLNIHLVQTLSHTKRRHRLINPYEQKRNDVTHILVIIISIYLICVMPSIPFAAFFAYNPERYVTISFHYPFFQHLDDFGKFLMIFNSALQCYLYIFFGRRFRRELSRVLCCLCAKYFYVPIPQVYSNSDRETFLPDFGINNNEDAYELVLSGKWSLDHRQDSIAGIEFSFHHPRRWSRFTSSSGTTIPSESETSENIPKLTLVNRLKNRFNQLLRRLQ